MVITVNVGVGISEQIIADVVDMLVILLVEMSALTCRCNAAANGKPSVGGIDVSFVMDDLVDLIGDMVGAFSGKRPTKMSL